ncbi:FUSC family protein [Rhodococcus sp. NPDC003318]|uniref:FUSC family protein n=1 Tax=Rhodococcus sp. NPDC003318 TaxID=3364503 RepID=UPI00367B6810
MTTATLTAPARLRHSRDALAHSVSADAWRRSLRMRSADATLAVSVRVGLAAAIVLVVFGLAGHGTVAGFAVLGSLASAFSRHEPLRRTAQKVGFVGSFVVVAVLAGGLIALTGAPLWAQVGLMALVSGGGAAVLFGFRVAGPGPVVLVFAATAAVGYVSSVATLGVAVLCAAIGATVGFVTALVPFAFLPWGPARLAAARALAAVAAVPDGADVGAAHAAISSAREKLALTSGSVRRHEARDLAAVLSEAECALDEWERGAGARLRDIVRHEKELRKIKRHKAILGGFGDIPVLPRPTPFLADGLARLRRHDVLTNAARVVLAAAAAGWLASAIGLDHPLWASMGAMAALQGVTYGPTVQRAIQRLLGNVGGAVIAAALIALSLGYWQSVIVVAIMQTGAEVMAPRNYALCSIFVTPMALLVVGLGATVDPAIGVSRVLDTLVGVVVGVVVAAVTISRSDRTHLPAVA